MDAFSKRVESWIDKRMKGKKVRMYERKEGGPEEVVFDFSDAHYVIREEVCYVVEEGRP